MMHSVPCGAVETSHDSLFPRKIIIQVCWLSSIIIQCIIALYQKAKEPHVTMSQLICCLICPSALTLIDVAKKKEERQGVIFKINYATLQQGATVFRLRSC